MTEGAPFQAILTERRDSGAGLKLVTLTPARERAVEYRAPGQYIEVQTTTNGVLANGYFVLASELGAPSWELLVRKNGGASDALTGCPEGTVFDIVGPLGVGFPLERARGRSLVVAVAGSALAVTRPILRDRIARREGTATSVYIGVRSVDDLALAPEVAGWVHAGVRVVLCLSKGELDNAAAPLTTTRRARGYVQNVLANDVIEGVVAGMVFAAGPSGMLAELRSLAEGKAAGRDALEVITNV
jgi:NAD(P)H-flavin reductase